MNAIKQDVKALVQKELESANKKFPKTFRSRHEAYGVMLEEFEEAQNDLECCMKDLEMFKRSMKHDGIQYEEHFIKCMKEYAINLACEAVQLAAMAQKALDSMEEWK